MPRLVDDADLACATATPRYGGQPSPLRDPATLERAQHLLLQGERVSDVARETGYSKYSAFSAAYERETGERPSVYQRRHGVSAKRSTVRGPRLYRRPPPDRSGEVPLPRYRTPPEEPKGADLAGSGGTGFANR